MNNRSTTTRVGVGFFDLLTLVFIVLKLTKVISWSWAWVLSPVWIGLIVVLILITIVTLYKHRSGR